MTQLLRTASSILALVILGSCGGAVRTAAGPAGRPAGASPVSDRPIVSMIQPTARPTARPTVRAPHGGRIDRVAVTDRGDAALTSDSFSELRLWPALDGSQEPVVIHGPAPVQLALGRDGDRLCAAILDEAGAVTLLQLDARGGLLGRAQLAAAPAVEQVVVIPGGVLVRRADHVIERFDARGAPRGRLVPAPGQRVVSLAVRRDRAVAGLTDQAGDRATIARWLVVGSALGWGPAIELPEPLGQLALAPGGRRLAGIARRAPLDEEVGIIVDLVGSPVIAGEVSLEARDRPRGSGRGAARDAPVIGFSDDDTVVAGVAGHLIWASLHRAAWTVDRHRPYGSGGLFAIADRVTAAGSASLHLMDASRIQFLGYAFLGDGRPFSERRFHDGGGVLLETEPGRLWLDRQLRGRLPMPAFEMRELELVLDDLHLLFLRQLFDQPGKIRHRVMVRDLNARDETEIAVLEDITVAHYDAATHVLAIASGEDIVRYRLGFDPLSVTPLRTLARAGALSPFYLTDPQRAGGVVGVVDARGARQRARIYKITGEDRGPPVLPVERVLAGPIAAVDRAGALYVVSRGVQVYRDALTGAPARLSGVPAITALSHDGAQIAIGFTDTVSVVDPHGVTRWTAPVWHAGPVAWSPDDRTLFVAAEGGATISFDAMTGARIAMQCGWGFGLYDRDIAQSSNTPSACAAR